MFNGEKSCTKSFSPQKIEKLLVHILTTFPFKWQKKIFTWILINCTCSKKELFKIFGIFAPFLFLRSIHIFAYRYFKLPGKNGFKYNRIYSLFLLNIFHFHFHDRAVYNTSVRSFQFLVYCYKLAHISSLG